VCYLNAQSQIDSDYLSMKKKMFLIAQISFDQKDLIRVLKMHESFTVLERHEGE